MEPEAPKPKNKPKVFFIVLAALFYLVFIYLDVFGNTLNIYLTVIKEVCLLLTFVIPSIYFFVAKDTRLRWYSFIAVVWAVTITLRTIDEIQKYNERVYHTRFGKGFNEHRHDLGIALIQDDWEMQMHLKPDTEMVWRGKHSVIGHASKTVYIDSAGEDKFEIDYYSLKPLRGVSRSISIGEEPFEYIVYGTYSCTYTFGGSRRRITKNEADSILTAEKIQKDY